MVQLPAEMTAIEITEPGGPEVLRPARRPLPEPALGEVLIEVAAAGVNRPDTMQRQGIYPPPPGASDLPGLEVSGTVVANGPGARRYEVGDAVCALTHGGGYAEYCVAPETQTLPVPAGLPVADAAGLPETCFTVWTNAFERARLRAGERLLVHGGSSGIGTTAIQIASALGVRVFATAGSMAAVGPYVAQLLLDATGGYGWTFALAAASNACAVALAFTLPAPVLLPKR